MQRYIIHKKTKTGKNEGKKCKGNNKIINKSFDEDEDEDEGDEGGHDG